MSIKRFPLTEDQFRSLSVIDGWRVDDVPEAIWSKIPGLQRKPEIVGVMASGCYNEPRVLNGIRAVVGMDVLVHETNPKPGEADGNAYHWIIQKTNQPDSPYVLIGPFKSETIVSHWFDADDLNTYWN